MGFDDLLKEGEQSLDGQTAADQQVANQQAGGHDSVEDTAIDSVVDEIASKEGASAAFDPEINNVVNDEVNKF